MEEFSGNAKRIWHLITPGALIILLFILNIIPHSIPNYGAIKPDFMLIAIFYWAVHRPGFMPPSICFLLGVLMDIFSALPLGLTAFIFILLHKFTRDQRKVFLGQPYYVSWIGFIFICAVCNILKSAGFYFITGNWPEPNAIYLSTALTIGLFPIVTIFLIASHKLMSRAEQEKV